MLYSKKSWACVKSLTPESYATDPARLTPGPGIVKNTENVCLNQQVLLQTSFKRSQDSMHLLLMTLLKKLRKRREVLQNPDLWRCACLHKYAGCP